MIDRSDAADARRLRWILNGHGYFMEENTICGHPPCDQDEQDDARIEIDRAIALEAAINAIGISGVNPNQ